MGMTTCLIHGDAPWLPLAKVLNLPTNFGPTAMDYGAKAAAGDADDPALLPEHLRQLMRWTRQLLALT